MLAATFLPTTFWKGAVISVDFNALNWTGPGGLRERLAAIADPRHRRGVRHAVDQVLLLALAAVVAGQRTYVAISDWIQGLRPNNGPCSAAAAGGLPTKCPANPPSAAFCNRWTPIRWMPGSRRGSMRNSAGWVTRLRSMAKACGVPGIEPGNARCTSWPG